MTATIHTVAVEKASGELAREQQLAWKLAELATRAKEAPQDDEAVAMAKNRIIDNAAIALGAANETAVRVARADALASQGTGSATIWGLTEKFAPVPAAFANSVAVRFLDNDDCYLAAEYSHPDDNISPIIAVGQQLGVSGADILRGVVVAYEVHVALVGTGDGRASVCTSTRSIT